MKQQVKSFHTKAKHFHLLKEAERCKNLNRGIMIVGHGQKKVKSREQDASAAIAEMLITIFNRTALLQALFFDKLKTILYKNFYR